jgi:hypothetical protein
MEPATTLRFAEAARALAAEARACGLTAPGFRSPPRLAGADRTIRRRSGGAVVSVRVRQRPWGAVLADMIEGVIVANEVTGAAADPLRARLWAAAAPVSPSVEEQARVA